LAATKLRRISATRQATSSAALVV